MDKTKFREVDYNINCKNTESGKLDLQISPKIKVACKCKIYIKSFVKKTYYKTYLNT